MDKADATTRGAIKAAAHAAQWDEDDDDEAAGDAYGSGGSGYGAGVYGGHTGGGGEYDDEYDDSFDAYGGGAADGVADAEGTSHLILPRACQGPRCFGTLPSLYDVSLAHALVALTSVWRRTQANQVIHAGSHCLWAVGVFLFVCGLFMSAVASIRILLVRHTREPQRRSSVAWSGSHSGARVDRHACSGAYHASFDTCPTHSHASSLS